MLSNISSVQWLEWKAFYRLHPFGEWRADLRAARICSLIANVNRDDKKVPRPYQPGDFIPDFSKDFEETEPLSAEELSLKLMAAFAPMSKEG